MIIRPYLPGDASELSRIHQQYEGQFTLAELGDEKFVVTTDDGEIILIGANHSLSEIRLATDKSKPVKMRREALIHGFQVSEFVAKRAGYNQLHAFVQDRVWLKQLLKHGFRPTAGVGLVIDI
jgi:hypothetical protein